MHLSRAPLTGALALAVAMGVGLSACGSGDAGDASGEASADGAAARSAADGRASGEGAYGGVDIHELEELPDVSLEDLDGTSHDLRSLVGGPTVINFWATWCAPCERELPELVEVDDAIRGSGGRVLGIAVSSGAAEEIRSFAREHGVDFPLYRANQSWAGRHFGLYGLPTTLVVDDQGRVHEQLLGPQTVESLMAHLRPLMEES